MDVTKTKQKTQKKVKTRYMAGVAMLSAAAFVLQYLEFPIPMLIPGFIKFDFSDLPALIGAFAYGPAAGVLIEFIKNILHCAVSQSATVGELSNFILGAVFAGIAGLVYRNKKTKTRAIIGAVLGALLMGAICIPSNYFVVYPFYDRMYMPMETIINAYNQILPVLKSDSILPYLLVFNVPFTIIKGLLVAVITILIYKPLSPILKGR